MATKISRPRKKASAPLKRLLNVGGGSKDTSQFPAEFGQVEHLMLDIDPNTGADIVMDAKELVNYEGKKFDIIWASHVLEHFRSSDIPSVIRGFHHVLNENGIVWISVPDIKAVMRNMLLGGQDLVDIAYTAPNNGNEFPVTFGDMIWGSHLIMSNGNLFYQHQYGFTAKSIEHIFSMFGFEKIVINEDRYNLTYVGKKATA